MTFRAFLKDHIISIFLCVVFMLFTTPLLASLNKDLAFFICLLGICLFIFILCYEFFRRKKFYDKLIFSLDKLDQKYLLSEVLDKPHFLDGKILADALYETNKSMTEEVKASRDHILEFKEYIELWVHDVKIPIASALLKIHNHPELKTMIDEIHRLERQVDQVLYYARSENTEKDYLIKECSLERIVSSVIRNNKDSLLLKNIRVNLNNLDHMVLTDSKWLEFMIEQIVSNSIKYSKDKNAVLSFEVTENEKETTLMIMDNGIGIPPQDVPRVFEKSFTGENGRKGAGSTGMGLYLCKKLCDKLGHHFYLKSSVSKYTKVYISFAKEDYYKMNGH